MKINAENEEVSQYIRSIKLNGKIVAMATVINTDEGWIEIKVPHIKHAQDVQTGQEVDITDQNAGQYQFDWETKRLHGQIEIDWYDNTPSHYKTLGNYATVGEQND